MAEETQNREYEVNQKITWAVNCLQKNEIVKDCKTAVEILIEKAKEGNGWAQYNLGAIYYNGNGVPKNDLTYEEFIFEDPYRSLCDAELYKIGERFLQNIEDYKIAFKFFKALADVRNYAEAQYALGMMYYRGKGVEINYANAKQYFQLAAKQNHGFAKEMLENLSAASRNKPATLLSSTGTGQLKRPADGQLKIQPKMKKQPSEYPNNNFIANTSPKLLSAESVSVVNFKFFPANPWNSSNLPPSLQRNQGDPGANTKIPPPIYLPKTSPH